MPAFRLWMCDLWHGRQDKIYTAGTTGATTAHKALNGDPLDQWVPGVATGANFVVTDDSQRKVVGVGIAGHNLQTGSGDGADLTVSHASSGGGAWGGFGSLLNCPTPDSFIVDCGSGQTNYAFRLQVNDAPEQISIGVIAFLGPYGYDADGTLNSSQGGVVELKNEASLGLLLPIGRGLLQSEARVSTPYGVQQLYRMGRARDVFRLRFNLLRGANDYEWWRIVRSYRERSDAAWTNPAWYKGVWLTTDEFDAESNPQAYYCLPVAPPSWEISERGGRISGEIQLVTVAD